MISIHVPPQNRFFQPIDSFYRLNAVGKTNFGNRKGPKETKFRRVISTKKALISAK